MLADALLDPTLGRGIGWMALEWAVTFLGAASCTAATLRAALGPGMLRRDRTLLALGAGPALVPLILHVLLVLLPGRPSGFYVTTVALAFLAVAFLSRRHFAPALRETRAWWRWFLGWRAARRARSRPRTVHALLVGVFVVAVACRAIVSLLTLPLVGHDTWEYGSIARAIFVEKQVQYRAYPYFAHNGFFSVSLHAPSFPLFHTWERMFDEVLGVAPAERFGQIAHKDSLFRSVSLYYGFLVLLATGHALRRSADHLALAGMIALLGSPAFFVGMFTYYVDSFRIFFALASFRSLHAALGRPSPAHQAILGACCGLSAFAHSIGAIGAGICVASFALIVGLRLAPRALACARVAVFALAFGGWHYVADLLIGTGWILRR